MALDIGQLLAPMIKGAQGLTMLSQGADIAVGGANYSAAAFRTAGQLAVQGAAYQADVLRRSGDIALQGAAYQKQVLNQAKEVAQEGGEYQAQVYATAGASAIAIANYNKALDEVDTNRALDAMGRQMRDLYSTNRASMGSSGIGLGSKSYLAVTADAMSTYERNLVQIRNSALQRQQGIMYNGNLTAVEYMNNANAAKYSANIAKYNYDTEIKGAEYQAQIANYSYQNQAVAAEYQGQVDQYNYEAQARKAEYEGQIAQYQADSKMASNIGDMAGTAAGQIFSLF